METVISGHKNIIIKLCELYGSETVKSDLFKELYGRCHWIVTTRLDNDDGIHCDFVARLHRSIEIGRREALNFPQGIVFHGGKPYLSYQRSNAFLSLSEPFEGFETVLCAPHNEMQKYVSVRDVDAAAAWLQVIHDTNVSNKLRGIRIMRRYIPPGFDRIGDLRAGAVEESTWGVALENATFGITRSIRDKLLEVYRDVRHLVGNR